jgi:hypothetical protein
LPSGKLSCLVRCNAEPTVTGSVTAMPGVPTCRGGLGVRTDDDDPEDIDRAYRQAAKRLHSDAGGTTADFQRLQEAKRVLAPSAS